MVVLNGCAGPFRSQMPKICSQALRVRMTFVQRSDCSPVSQLLASYAELKQPLCLQAGVRDSCRVWMFFCSN